jgi:cell wall-associated NlpC family hydrolase
MNNFVPKHLYHITAKAAWFTARSTETARFALRSAKALCFAALILTATLLCACESPKINVSDQSGVGEMTADLSEDRSSVSESAADSTDAPDTSIKDTAVFTGDSGTSPNTGDPDSSDTDAEIVSPPDSGSAVPSAESVAGITDLAMSLIGEPFLFGGDSPGVGFDSSGFIYYVLRTNGYVAVPRGLNDQTGFGTLVADYDDVQPGDILFFSTGKTRAEFGGIYIGGGSMITCQDEGQTVKEVNITSTFYRDSFYCATRVA